MAFISKISGVSYDLISKIGTILNENVQKVGGIDVPPRCRSIPNLAYGSTAKIACQNTERTTHYHDETNDILYTDSCGGTEATYGFYSDGRVYREYSSQGLSTTIADCPR